MITIIKKIYNSLTVNGIEGLSSIATNILRLWSFLVFLTSVMVIVVWMQFSGPLLMSLSWRDFNGMFMMIVVAFFVSTAIGIVGDVLVQFVAKILSDEAQTMLEGFIFLFALSGSILMLLLIVDRNGNLVDFLRQFPQFLSTLLLYAHGAFTLTSCIFLVILKRNIQARLPASFSDMRKLISASIAYTKNARWYVVLFDSVLAMVFPIAISILLILLVHMTAYFPELLFLYKETADQHNERKAQVVVACRSWHVKNCHR